MNILTRKNKFYFYSFLKYDLKASITVFFVALPLCLGISLASNAPVYSGILAGIIGGLFVSIISRSPLSVSGPAAGLTAICAAAIVELGNIELFFLAVFISGFLQAMLGVFKLGGFTHFIPSSVIKGMLAAIGILLISKQVPLIIGYNKPDFWTDEFFNIITFNHAFSRITDLYHQVSPGALIIVAIVAVIMWLWNKYLVTRIPFIPVSFVIVLAGSLLAYLLKLIYPAGQLLPTQYVNIPRNVFSQFRLPEMGSLFSNALIWKNGVIICFVATLETLLSLEAIDKLDAYNRVSPQNRELVAQGAGNMLSGFLGGLPITAVIVRSSANAEAGGRTRLSAMAHGFWLLLAILIAIPLINFIPYSVLALILIRTGYNLAKPAMIKGVYKQGREQFLPFIITIIAILFTDLLIGVVIGFIYSIYFLIKHTYRAGFVVEKKMDGHTWVYHIDLALNVSFLNKRKFMEMLDKVPEYSVVHIDGSKSVYIDHDILEIFHDFRPKAHLKHIDLRLIDIPDVETIVLH